METNPIVIFQKWFQDHLRSTQDQIPQACCLSTIGLDEFPNARFVSLKDILEDHFIVTGQLNSRKGLEIRQNNKAALSFWWPESGRQIRIQGSCTEIGPALADKYFYERSRDSRIVSIISNQGQELVDINELIKKYELLDQKEGTNEIKRPDNWGGFSIKPMRIEFFEFQPTRFHKRQLFTNENGQWTIKDLQP